jgi:Leucine-rich repeat (LRR) protein
LESLDLSDNQLCGEIPVELKNLSSLPLPDVWGAKLKLDNNHLIPPNVGTSDAELLAWLDSHSPGWDTTQTPCPQECKLQFSSATYSIKEDEGQATITVTRTGSADGAVSVEYATSDDTATAPNDYTQTTGTLNWADGSLADKTFTIDIIDENEQGNDETLIISLNNPTGGAELGSPNTAVLTINNPKNCATVTEIPYEECEVLVAFYNSTDGANWSYNYGWNVTDTPCSWSGVECSGGHVSKLSLSSNQLTSSIPTELGNLSKLESLNLSDNQLTGSIPTELVNLTKLTYLDLSDNQFTGSIPTELGNLNNLERLDLSNNQLTGSIPTELGNLNNLERLDLSNNQLTGSIPTELGNLNNLERLDLSNNQLTGSIPTELGNLNNLERLDLSNNQLTGSIPTNLKVSYLNLSNNQLTGLIPINLSASHLELDSNQLCGKIPTGLKNMIAYEYNRFINNSNTYNNEINIHVSLNNNHLDQLDLETIYQLDQGLILDPMTAYTQTPCPITILHFLPATYSVTENGGQITITAARVGVNDGTISANYATTDDIATAGNDYVQTTGTLTWADGDSADKTFTITIIDDDQFEIPETFTITLIDPISGENLDIATVIINENDPFDCAIVTEIPTTECEALVALYNNTDGANWRRNEGWDITNMPCSWDGVECQDGHVSQISLSNNQLTGSIPTELGNLSNLTFLDLSSNQITGSIPKELDNLNNLQKLDLSENQLTSSIPRELGNLNKLETLWLNNNQLTGSISSQLGNLSNLSTLNLSSNQLTGSIPSQLGNLSRLSTLNLSSNQLTGSIPSQLGNLSNLSTLNLSSNQLTGSIPSQLGNLTNLTGLFLSNNQLSGEIPAELGNLSNLDYLQLNNNQLCGEIPVELKNLSKIRSSYVYSSYDLNLNTNHLTTSDSELIKWLNDYNPNWKYTQTSCSTASVRFSSTTYNLAGNNGQVTVTVTRAGNQAISANYEYNQTTGTLTWAEGDLADKTIPITIIDDGKSEEPETFTITLTDPVSGENLDNATIIINNLFDCTTVTEIPIQECQALIALYDSTGGANWYKWYGPSSYTASPERPLGWIDTYMPLDNLCQWEGVECSGGHITALELAFTNLVGFIPPELGNLSHLKTLQLGTTYDAPVSEILGRIEDFCGGDVFCLKASGWILYNHIQTTESQLSGSIPPELGNLSQLETLQLGVGNLSGTIPPELGNLSQLKTLELHYNSLCGVIPVELKNLSNLSDLSLGNNHLSTSDSELIIWLNELNPGWETTQTPCPIATLQFESTIYYVIETDGQATFTVTRTGSGARTVNYATTDGTATAGSDYAQTTGTLTWADGDLADKTITIAITDDGDFEGPETFTITLTDPNSGESLDNATITIYDNYATFVTLAYFTATANETGILLEWQTAIEIDNAGFHLWRATGEGWKSGDYSTVIRLTEQVIAAQGNSSLYTYRDTEVESGITYYYGLEDIDLNGQSTFHWDLIDSATAR